MLAEDIALELWENVLLTTLATMTCLMRGAVGDIVAADEGAALVTETLEACAGTTAAAGHAPREKAVAAFRKRLLERGSRTASMLRDVESGNRTRASTSSATCCGAPARRASSPAGCGPGTAICRCTRCGASARRSRGPRRSGVRHGGRGDQAPFFFRSARNCSSTRALNSTPSRFGLTANARLK